MELTPDVGAERLNERVSDVIMKTMAHQVVARERNVAAPRGPTAVWLPAPPNAPARSAALPLCSIITAISTRQTSTCNVTSTGVYRQPIQIRPTATARDKPHFAHEGICCSCFARGAMFALATLLKINDGRERLRIQARATYKGAVNLRLRHQSLGVVGLYTSAVENSNPGCLVRTESG